MARGDVANRLARKRFTHKALMFLPEDAGRATADAQEKVAPDQGPAPPRNDEGKAGEPPGRGSGRERAQHVGQDAAVAEVFQLVQRIDAAGERHLLA